MTSNEAVVLSGGGDFGDPWHPFAETSAALAMALRGRGYEVTISTEVETSLAALSSGALPSLLVVNIGWYGHERFSAPAIDGLIAALQRGLPTLLVHSTLTAFPDWSIWREIAGGGWTYGTTYHPDYAPGTALARPDHPLASELGRLSITDERYTSMWVEDDSSVFLEHEEDGERHPLGWTRAYGPSPIVADALGHDADSYRAPGRVALLQRELDWLGAPAALTTVDHRLFRGVEETTVSGLAIDRAEVIVASPGRNFVTLKVTTTDGLIGWGDGTLNGRELAVASYLSDHILPLLPGRDAHAVEHTWQYLYRGAYWRGGPVTMAAIAAVDMALWDLKAKAAGLPLYQLLGGATRTGCLAYTHATGRDIPELLDSAQAHRELGYRAIRLQTAIPGIQASYGVPTEGKDYEPAARGAEPKIETWDTRAYLRYIPSVFEEARNRFGPELILLHDAHHRLTPTEAVQLGRSLEPYDLFWLEDVMPVENQALFRQVRSGTTIPLAIGEIFTSPWDANLLITERLIDYLRASVTHAGGITGLGKMLSFAELYAVKSGCHGPTDVSPIGMAAALHLGLSIHNFGIQEHMPHAAVTDEAFPHAYRFADGSLHPGDEPGLGVALDEEIAGRYPYQPAYLPVNQLADGTVHDW